MKKIFLLAGLCLAMHYAKAQTWAEWFQQKETQKKYLLQQIAALKVYLGYAEKGYEIAGKGINTVRNIKNGDFNLHRDFFNSLNEVNPQISRFAKVAGIIVYQLQIVKQSKEALQALLKSKQFTPEEMSHIKRVFELLLDECSKTLDELAMVTTSGEVKMTDDERLSRIDGIYTDIQGKYSFACSFKQEIALLSAQRFAEGLQTNRSKLLNGLK